MNNNPLPIVSETKILGVTIDCHLNFKTHIHNISNRANSRIFLLKKLHFCGANESCKPRFYTSCILPILVYRAY